jgi:REP element-mobilizing transposase RayT
MSRKLRFIPDQGALVEVTCRAFQSRFLFRPGPILNGIILGALARAKSLYPVRICAFAFLSGHFHLILEADDARQLSRFMGHFNSKVAREIGRLTGWREKIFGRRYQAILISSEPEAQIARLRYVLSHGVKEGLVERLKDWPGVHCVEALTEGKVLEGWWFDRTKEYLARRRGEDFGPFQYATRETLELDPLPCWKHLPEEKRQHLAAALASEIEEEAADRRERTGVSPLGPAAILAQSPQSQPARTKRSPAPAVHAASVAVRRELRNAYCWFVASYRDAAEKLRAGKRDQPFPLGCFPPALPFVGG